MKIKEIVVNVPFKYLWLKKIIGVDLSVHCAKSLLGEYNPAINNRIKIAHDIELDGTIYYLCGVAIPYKWENNFHLAWRKCIGKSFEYSSNGIYVVLEDAQRIEFSEDDVDWNLPQAKKKEFHTCRNWQFACKMQRVLFGL